MSLSRSKRRANIPILRKNQLCACLILRVPNLHTAPKRHLIKIRTFLKKIDSYLEKYKFARRFEGLRLDQILKFCTAIKHLTNFQTTNLKLLLSIQILCASHFKFV